MSENEKVNKQKSYLVGFGRDGRKNNDSKNRVVFVTTNKFKSTWHIKLFFATRKLKRSLVVQT